jgi:hypothetical protein
VIIEFHLGRRQRFRPRIDDITVQGRVHAAQMPVRRALWRLNGAGPAPFRVEPTPDLLFRLGSDGRSWPTPVDWRTGYKETAAGLRLKSLGDFNIEVPISHPSLKPGINKLEVEIEDHGKVVDRGTVELEWDPTPVPLPLDLSNLSTTNDISEVGQQVNGCFEVVPERNCIRSATPADPDSLLILGSPGASQEATYRVVFHEPAKAKYVGLSDFFVRNESEDPPIGIKPGYSTAGLATVRGDGQARIWLALADNAHRSEGWLVCTEPAKVFHPEGERPYRVRHQLMVRGDVSRSRFRIWAEDEAEPGGWLCEESNAAVPPGLPRFHRASFGLFMHTGVGSEWSDIRVRHLEQEG